MSSGPFPPIRFAVLDLGWCLSGRCWDSVSTNAGYSKECPLSRFLVEHWNNLFACLHYNKQVCWLLYVNNYIDSLMWYSHTFRWYHSEEIVFFGADGGMSTYRRILETKLLYICFNICKIVLLHTSKKLFAKWQDTCILSQPCQCQRLFWVTTVRPCT